MTEIIMPSCGAAVWRSFGFCSGELARTAPDSPERTTVFASLENVSRAIAERMARQSLSGPSL